METPIILRTLKASKSIVLTALQFIFLLPIVNGQDLAMPSEGAEKETLLLPTKHEINKVDVAYPECPNPTGVLRFISDDHETIRFSEKPIKDKFYYVIRIEYANNPNPSLIEVKDGDQLKIDYSEIGVPDKVSVQRVCNLLEVPFIYHSDWVEVSTVHSFCAICRRHNMFAI
jgi:hypothetical protein